MVSEYLQTKMDNTRVAGPFSRGESTVLRINRFDVIPKNHQPNKWRLIVNLSYPEGHSVNDGIPKSLCSLSYISVDDVINHIPYTWKFSWYVNFADFTVTYGYSKNLICENLLV